MKQVTDLCKKHKAALVIAGDIFHKWKTSPEVVNRAITALNSTLVFAVSGQHDQPHHRYEDIKKSSYWTLVEAGAITDLVPGEPYETDLLTLHGFPWGHEPEPLDIEIKGESTHLAVIHNYVWNKGNCYPGAPADRNVRAYRDKIKGYDLAVFGDNHKGFLFYNNTSGYAFNCGALMPTRSDEKDYAPTVGLLYQGGSIIVQYLDTSNDKWLDENEVERVREEISSEGFMEAMQDLEDVGVSFSDAMKRVLAGRKMRKQVDRIIARAMEGKDK